MKILLVHRDPDLRGYLGKRLALAGHQVTRVEDIDVATTILLEATQDVLIVGDVAGSYEAISFGNDARTIDPDMLIYYVSGFSLIGLTKDNQLAPPRHISTLAQEILRAPAPGSAA